MSSPGFPPSVYEETLERACFRMAITDRSMGHRWSDVVRDLGSSFGTAAVDGALRGGVSNCATAASAGATSGRVESQTATLEGTALERFYCRARWKLATAAYANGLVGVGWENTGVWTGTDHILLGMRGATSTTLWTGRVGANSASSTIAVDTGWHAGEIWCDGTAHYLSVDDETPVAITSSTPGAALYLQYGVSNGATATAQSYLLDWGFWAWDQTTT